MSATQNNDLLNYLDGNETYKPLKDSLAANLGTAKEQLKANYESAVKAWEDSAEQQRQTATVRNNMLLKYLPEYHATMGLYGNGASETAMLDATARHRSALGAIDAAAAAGKHEALKAYNEGLFFNDQKYQSDLSQLYREAKSNGEARKNAIYENARTGIGQGWYDRDNLQKYIETLQGKVSNEQFADLKAIANSVIADDLKQGMQNYVGDAAGFEREYGGYFGEGSTYGDQLKQLYSDTLNVLQKEFITPSSALNVEVSGVPDNLKKGNNITVKIDGEPYKMELGDIVPSDNPAYNASANVGDQGVFLYDGEVYYKSGNIICRLQKRKTADASDNGYRSLIGYLRGKE